MTAKTVLTTTIKQKPIANLLVNAKSSLTRLYISGVVVIGLEASEFNAAGLTYMCTLQVAYR